jgi:hypothetical protein
MKHYFAAFKMYSYDMTCLYLLYACVRTTSYTLPCPSKAEIMYIYKYIQNKCEILMVLLDQNDIGAKPFGMVVHVDLTEN